MNYTDVTRIYEYLESTDGIIAITPVNMSGFVSHTQSINGMGDIVPGSVNTADISIDLLDIRGSVSSYQNREFIYRKGYALAPTRERLTTAASAYIKTDTLTAYLSTNGKTLTVTDGTDTNSYSLTAEAAALAVEGNTLTVLFAAEPYAQQYTIAGATLTGPTTPEMLAYDKNTAAEYARQNASYWVSGDTLTEFKVSTILGARYLDTTVFEMHTKGIFKASRPTRATGGQYNLTATDRMELFSADCISVLNSSPATASDLLTATCAAVGVALAQKDRYNADFAIVVPDDQESCTGEQILTWLGEIMGCSWRIDAAGELESVWFAQKDVHLTRDDYVSFSYETFMVEPIDKVMTGSSYADVVGLGGTGANVLLIDGNALIPYTEQSDLNSFSEGLLAQVNTVPAYRPGTLSGYANAELTPGDVIQVDNDDDEPEYVCITQMTETGFVLTITSSGNQRREVQNYMGVSLQVLKRSLAELTEEVGEFPARWEESIKNTVDLITGGMGGTRVDLFNPDTGKPSGTAYLFDSSDISTAKKLLVINAGGMAFYDNGFNVDDPSSSVPSYVVMNNQGQVNAGAILTGTLDALKVTVVNLNAGSIVSGILRSTNGALTIDLDNAALRAGNSATVKVGSDSSYTQFLWSGFNSYVSGELRSGVENSWSWFNRSMTAIFSTSGFTSIGYKNAAGELRVGYIFDPYSDLQSGYVNYLSGDTYCTAISNADILRCRTQVFFENSVPGANDGQLQAYGANLVLYGLSFGTQTAALSADGEVQAAGATQRIVTTESYGARSLNAMQSPTALACDSGSGTIGDDGVCLLTIHPILDECLEPQAIPQWIVTGSAAGFWVEKKGRDAEVHGPAGATFDWLVLAPQIGYGSAYAEASTAELGTDSIDTYGYQALDDAEKYNAQNTSELEDMLVAVSRSVDSIENMEGMIYE